MFLLEHCFILCHVLTLYIKLLRANLNSCFQYQAMWSTKCVSVVPLAADSKPYLHVSGSIFPVCSTESATPRKCMDWAMQVVGAAIEDGSFPKSMLKFVFSFKVCSDSKGIAVLNTVILMPSDGTLDKELQLLISWSSVEPLAPLSFTARPLSKALNPLCSGALCHDWQYTLSPAS